MRRLADRDFRLLLTRSGEPRNTFALAPLPVYLCSRNA